MGGERLTWRRHTDMAEGDFAPVWALYEKSFPLHERRLPAHQSQAMADRRYVCESVWEGETLLGLLFSWHLEGLCYVEHFAVSEALRCGGVGSDLLRDFCRREGQVVLEIDPPVTDIARRRQGFYERLGFCPNPWPHAHPPYRKAFSPHELVVMSWPSALEQGCYDRFYRALAREVMAYAE